jgi:MFS family permease
VREQKTQRSSALEPLRHRHFVACFAGSLISHSASWMQSLTVPVVILELTGSQTWLGLAAFAGQAPALVFGPLGGIIAERYPRKRILLAAMCVQMLTALALAAMWWGGAMTAERVLPVLLIAGIASTLFITAWQSFVPLLVPEAALASAYRLNSVQFTFSRALGPAIGGFVLEGYGPGAAFLVNGLSYLLPLAAVALSRPRAVPTALVSNPVREFADAVRHATGHPALWIPILTTTWIGLFGQSIQPLNAGIARNVFGVGELELGFMGAAFGTASMIMSVALALIGDRLRRSAMAQLGLAGYALGVLTLGATHSFPTGLVGYFVMGFSQVLVHVNISTSMQVHLDERFRARVTSIYLTGLIAATPVGALLGGAIGDWVGLEVTARLFAAMLALYALVARLCLRGMRPLDSDVHV